MPSSQTKNKIYALISIFVMIITAASFAVTVNFLLKIKNIAFSADSKIIKEKTTVLDMESFNKIKSKLIMP